MSEILALSVIRVDGDAQPCAANDVAVIEAYAQTMRDGQWGWQSHNLPIVYYDGETYWLASGFHRFAAAGLAGLETLPVELRQGTRRDAILCAAGAGLDHNLHRSNEDKRRVVLSLLCDEEWGTWANSKIAAICGVSEGLVRKVKAELKLSSNKMKGTKRNGKKHGALDVAETERSDGQMSEEATVRAINDAYARFVHETGSIPDYSAEPQYANVVAIQEAVLHSDGKYDGNAPALQFDWSEHSQGLTEDLTRVTRRDCRRMIRNDLGDPIEMGETRWSWACPLCRQPHARLYAWETQWRCFSCGRTGYIHDWDLVYPQLRAEHERAAADASLTGVKDPRVTVKASEQGVAVSMLTGQVPVRKNNDQRITPPAILERVLKVFDRIDLDPCSNDKRVPNIPAERHYTRGDDGMERTWRCGTMYMCPPLEETARWVTRLNSEYVTGKVRSAIALLPARTDEIWFKQLSSYACCFLWGKTKFRVQSCEDMALPCVVAYFGLDLEKFTSAFKDVGNVYHPSNHSLLVF